MQNVLFITLDSCRFDTFAAAQAPNLTRVAPLHCAQAPSYFTYGSHSAMFVGFTPGIAGSAQSFLDPKYGKLFKLTAGGHAGKGTEGYTLQGRNIIEGFRNAGFTTIGAGAMGWFDPNTPTGKHLSESFDHFFIPGPYHLRQQLNWIEQRLAEASGPTFTFLNVGETHVPYWHEGAPWSAEDNPCVPYQTVDRSADCRSRQRACLEWVDAQLGPLLERHREGTILVCGDHGDCWGEDGLWEHGIAHPMTTTVPLLIRFKGEPVARHTPARAAAGMWSRLRRTLAR
ncbi:sulfatase-like hydrolase/transferase [Devosia sp. 1566]|uniref:sulfatase-like hydrolase/transferase n=1 Tax=Devosia sp. 1566 TaxID=2499144 RepID=UPI000FDC94FA|nr:sulfatase-like hydrolase/transferase [Devosia sp. 1566]